MSHSKNPSGGSPPSVAPSTRSMSEADKIKSLVDRLINQPATIGHHSGYFIKKRQVDDLEDRLHKIMASGATSKSSTDLIELNQLLQDTRQRLQAAEDSLKASRASVIEKSKDLSEVNETLAACQRVLASSKSKWEHDRNLLVREIGSLREEALPLKTQLAAAKRGGDPEAALEAQSLKDQHSAKVSALQEELNKMNTVRGVEEANVYKLKGRIMALEQEHLAAQLHNKQLEEELTSSVTHSNGPLSPRSVELNMPVLKQLLGSRGIEWLKKADLSMRNDYRDRAYHLLQASKSAPSKAIRSFADIFEICFQWIKKTPRKIAQRIQPWIDEIEADFRAAKLKTFKYYRESLESIIQEKIKAVRQRNKAQGLIEDTPVSTVESIWHYCIVIKNRCVRQTKKTSNKCFILAKKIGLSFKAGFRRFTLLWRSSHKIIDNDSVIEMIDEEERLLNSAGGPVKTGIPKRFGKGKMKA